MFSKLNKRQKLEIAFMFFLFLWFLFNIVLSTFYDYKIYQLQQQINNPKPNAVINTVPNVPEEDTQFHPSTTGYSTGKPNNTIIHTPDDNHENLEIEPVIEDISEENMYLYFLDTGNSDCSLLILPNNEVYLFDSGDKEDGSAIVDFLNSAGVDHIDAFIGSHYHADHLGGAVEIMKQIPTHTVYLPYIPDEYTPTTYWFSNLMNYLIDNNVNVISPNVGDVISKSNNHEIIFLNSTNNKNLGEDQNSYSLATMISYGTHKYVIAGDLLSANESEIVSNWKGNNIDTDVIKANHHCSFTSNSQEWLSFLTPEYAVCTVAKYNDYDHPHDSVLRIFERNNIEVLRSDEDSTILIVDNGKEFYIETGLASANGEY